MKKALRETKTLRAGYSKAEPKIFAPPQTPFPGAQDGQNLISWRWSLPLPTNPIWRGSMHAISSYRGNRPTNTQIHKPTNTQTHRQDRLQYTAPLSLARSVTILQCAENSGKPLGGRGSALNPAGRAHSAPPDPLAGEEGLLPPTQEPHSRSLPSALRSCPNE